MTFPLTDLDLSEFHTGLRERAAALAAGAAGVSAEALSSTYNCVAIVNHVGQLKGGHCACLRAPSTPPPPPFARAPRHNPPPTPPICADTAAVETAAAQGKLPRSLSECSWKLFDDSKVTDINGAPDTKVRNGAGHHESARHIITAWTFTHAPWPLTPTPTPHPRTRTSSSSGACRRWAQPRPARRAPCEPYLCAHQRACRVRAAAVAARVGAHCY